MENASKLLVQASELVTQVCDEIKLTDQKLAPQILYQLADAGDAISIAQLFISDSENTKRDYDD